MKLNLKLLGANWTVGTADLPQFTTQTIMFGADVTCVLLSLAPLSLTFLLAVTLRSAPEQILPTCLPRSLLSSPPSIRRVARTELRCADRRGDR